MSVETGVLAGTILTARVILHQPRTYVQARNARASGPRPPEIFCSSGDMLCHECIEDSQVGNTDSVCNRKVEDGQTFPIFYSLGCWGNIYVWYGISRAQRLA